MFTVRMFSCVHRNGCRSGLAQHLLLMDLRRVYGSNRQLVVVRGGGRHVADVCATHLRSDGPSLTWQPLHKLRFENARHESLLESFALLRDEKCLKVRRYILISKF